MLRGIQLIVTSHAAWERIDAKQRGLVAVLFSIAPLLAVAACADAYSLERWGEYRGFSSYSEVAPPLAARYAGAQVGFHLAAIFASACLLMVVAQSFNFFTTFTVCFTIIGYGFTPLFFARFLDVIPQFPTWLSWGAGAAGAAGVLYHGVGVVMKPDQTKGFSLYIFAVMATWITSGLAHLLALGVLREKVFS